MGVDPPHLSSHGIVLGWIVGRGQPRGRCAGVARGLPYAKKESPPSRSVFPESQTANVYLHLLGAGYSTSTIAFRDARAGSESGPAYE